MRGLPRCNRYVFAIVVRRTLTSEHLDHRAPADAEKAFAHMMADRVRFRAVLVP